jgi:hypothetical protein
VAWSLFAWAAPLPLRVSDHACCVFKTRNAGYSFAIGGNNIPDQYPTRSIDDTTYFGNLPYDVLSPIGFNGAFYYARLQYKFYASIVDDRSSARQLR